MKDERASEEKLMGELDRMYRHVADLESSQAVAEHDHNPYGDEQISDQMASSQAKIIPFPGHRIHLPAGDMSEEEPRQKRKSSYHPYLIVASFSVIFLAFILVIIAMKVIIAPWGSGKPDPNQLTFPIHLTPPPSVQKEEEVLQNIEERQPKEETILYETMNPFSPFTQKRYYAVQVGAFRKRENASELIDALQKKDLEAYWIEMDSKSGRTIHIVFCGYFASRDEAAKFLKEKDILRNYSDSFVREVSFQEPNQ